ncbi:MAG: GntR family transcriptional regulator [Bythopirellula sp.]|nr:GntR family transcriptional regulator [Bythopirellula sp.]
MFLHIDAHNGLAVYDQIVRQVKFAVADGTLTTGELVPSVRELAKELAINPNTVARAYRQLQDEGVLAAVRGTGLAVESGARRGCQADRKRLIRQRLNDVLTEAHLSGLDDREIQELFAAELEAAKRQQGKS